MASRRDDGVHYREALRRYLAETDNSSGFIDALTRFISISDLNRRVETIHELIASSKQVLAEIEGCTILAVNVPASTTPVLDRALLYIHSNFRSSVTVQAIAAHVHRRPKYVSALFKRHLSISLKHYVLRLRLEYAARLIANGEKIEASGIDVGFRSKSAFYKQFKKAFGSSPGDFRRKTSQPAIDGVSHGIDSRDEP